MQPDPKLAPFEHGWYAAGPDLIWGMPGTYARIPGPALPPLPIGLCDGHFGWLPSAERASLLRYECQSHDEGVGDLIAREAEADALGLKVPQEVHLFLSDREVYSRVHSITGCFLEMSSALIDDPSGGDGKLIRFLCDSQGCVAWYLYITPTSACSVLGSGDWRDGPDDDQLEIDPADYILCGPTFEEFVLRFWMENEVWHRLRHGISLSQAQRDYLNIATANRALIPTEEP